MSAFFEWFAMGGHGPYVWAAYAITIVVLVLNVAEPLIAKRQLIKSLARRQRRGGL